MKYKWHRDNVPNPNKTHWNKENKVWYAKRNKQLFADRQVKTYRELMEMYGLCRTRLIELIEAQSGKFYERQE